MTSTLGYFNKGDVIDFEEYKRRFPREPFAVGRRMDGDVWLTHCTCVCHEYSLSCIYCTMFHWSNMPLEQWQAQFREEANSD